MKHKITPPVLAAMSIALLSFAAPVSAAPTHCPPGLAKKDPPCIPPGQARQMTEQEWYDRWMIGDRLDEHDWEYRNRDDIFDIYGRDVARLPDDQAYVVLDGGLVAVDRRTLEIVSIITFLSGL